MRSIKPLMAAAVVAALAGRAVAQTQSPAPPEPRAVGQMSVHDFAAKWMVQQDDLAEVGRYAAANQALGPPSPGRARVVLMGDSITVHWIAADLPAPAGLEVVNRGVAGQNTTQMLLRFESDVVALQPAAVVILGGTNDLRAYAGDPAAAGPQMLERLERNLTAMADIADARGIKVVICAIPPIGADAARLQRDPASLRQADAWLKAFAAARRYPFADYYAALADPAGALPASLSEDGLHPNTAGHRLMWPRLRDALAALGLGTPVTQ